MVERTAVPRWSKEQQSQDGHHREGENENGEGVALAAWSQKDRGIFEGTGGAVGSRTHKSLGSYHIGTTSSWAKHI